MRLEWIGGAFAVCKLQDAAAVDWSRAFTFLSQTDSELSLVCPEDAVPPSPLACEPGWRMLRVAGELDFSLVGILSKLTATLAERDIPVFAISTYDTDYLLVKQAFAGPAGAALREQGWNLT